ncbi:MAG: hypothetical protein WEC59_11650 [Salibacteraceae bacterium]
MLENIFKYYDFLPGHVYATIMVFLAFESFLLFKPFEEKHEQHVPVIHNNITFEEFKDGFEQWKKEQKKTAEVGFRRR